MSLSRTLVAAAVVCAGLVAPTAATAARSELPAPTPPGPFADVRKSVVTIDAPLPAEIVRDAPAACQQLRYLRYRRDGGPADPQQADAVLVIMPGTLAGAGSLEMHALQVVQEAADRGKDVEYWALDRRANCFEDRTGLDAGLAAGDPKVALDYYYRGREAFGRTFAGFPSRAQLRPVADFGLRRTIEDYRAVITEGLPDPEFRRTRAFCGGHSLGGALTGLLMAWDFDGDAATRGDAGYELCAGSIALDSSASRYGETAVVTQQPIVRELVKRTTTDVRNAIVANAIPRTVDFGFIGPETMLLLEGIGLNAQLRPDVDAAPLVAATPPTAAVDGAMRLMHSRTWQDAVARAPRLRRQHLSGEALLGAFMDDNAQPLAFIKTSVGSYTGGALLGKSFPFPTTPPMFFPVEDGRTYGWANYDEPQATVARGDGRPFTTAASEVTDVRDLARVLHGAPLDFLEHYYPTMLTADSILVGLGSRTGDFAHIRYDAAARERPRLTIVAADGLADTREPAGPPGVANEVVELPGYDHVDVITAAPRQADGSRERAALATTDFVLAQAGRTQGPAPAADTGPGASDATVAAAVQQPR